MQLAKTLRQFAGDNPVYFCVGTDLSVFDSLGPQVGKRLKERSNGSIIVYGIEGDNINARNVQKAYAAVRFLHPQSKIIAIDAAVGDYTGNICVKHGGIRPGSALGKNLGRVGDVSINCIFNSRYFLDFEDNYLFMSDDNNPLITQSMRNTHEQIKKYINTAADTIADAILIASAA